jgi:L-amino acid N-acyltransferase YncA
VSESATDEAVQPLYWYPRTEKFGTQDVTFKLMRPQDEASVENALLDFAQSLPASDLVFLRVDITQPDVVREWAQNIVLGRTLTVLAEIDGRLVGYGNLHLSRLQWTRHIGEIRILVDPRFRGLGLGEYLVHDLMKLAKENDLTRVVAHIGSEQPRVRAMFERLGFHAEALLTDWLMDRNHKKHDLVIMSLEVER